MIEKLNMRQRKFAEYYVQNGNAEQAAILAGYSETYARGNAHKLVANSCISAYIKELSDKLKDERILTAKDRQVMLSDIARNTENEPSDRIKAVDTLNQAREQIDAMGRNVTLAQRAYDMTARSYRNGTTELLDLRDAESSLNQAKLGLVNQKFQYISALMDLENTLNTDLTK